MKITVEQAVQRLIEELRKDKTEGSYYHSWQANIAMAFYDEYMRELDEQPLLQIELDSSEIAKISNNAAKRFLEQLTVEAYSTGMKENL